MLKSNLNTKVRINLFMEEVLLTLCLGCPPLFIMELGVFPILLGLGFYFSYSFRKMTLMGSIKPSEGSK